MRNFEKTHCIHGHSLADAYISKRGDWFHRTCRTCHRQRCRRWQKSHYQHFLAINRKYKHKMRAAQPDDPLAEIRRIAESWFT